MSLTHELKASDGHTQTHKFESRLIKNFLQVSMLQPFVAAFTRLEQCYRTSLAFTSNDDTRLVLSHGMIVDATALDTFFGDHFAGDDKEATIAAR